MTIIISLSLAAITGISVIAINHYKAFTELYGKLFIIIFGALACTLSWMASVAYSMYLIMSIDIDKSIQRQVIDAIGDQPTFYITAAIASFMFYMLLLDYIASKIDKNKNQNKK